MSKIAIVYWTGSGNTKQMAEAILEGVLASGNDGEIFFCTEFSPEQIQDYDVLCLGCPAMGAEVLEESEFQPFFDNCKSQLNQKKLALFGSYGWGDGEWMRIWAEECADLGANLLWDSLILNETPTEDGLNECRELGRSLT